MASGIQRGLVKMISKEIQKPRPASNISTLDCKKISKRKMREKSMNLSKNLASFRVLKTVLQKVTLTFSEEM
jgi:hypothetical protein